VSVPMIPPWYLCPVFFVSLMTFPSEQGRRWSCCAISGDKSLHFRRPGGIFFLALVFFEPFFSVPFPFFCFLHWSSLSHEYPQCRGEPAELNVPHLFAFMAVLSCSFLLRFFPRFNEFWDCIRVFVLGFLTARHERQEHFVTVHVPYSLLFFPLAVLEFLDPYLFGLPRAFLLRKGLSLFSITFQRPFFSFALC